MNQRDGKYLLTLCIGVGDGYEEELDIEDLDIDGWETMSDSVFEEALYVAWRKWADNYIDGGISRVIDCP